MTPDTAPTGDQDRIPDTAAPCGQMVKVTDDGNGTGLWGSCRLPLGHTETCSPWQTVTPADPAELDRAATEARRKALTEAWQAVDRAVRPLGTECGQSRWNAGYTQARDEAQNAILALRDEVKP